MLTECTRRHNMYDPENKGVLFPESALIDCCCNTDAVCPVSGTNSIFYASCLMRWGCFVFAISLGHLEACMLRQVEASGRPTDAGAKRRGAMFHCGA
jgi:hypothetical protein